MMQRYPAYKDSGFDWLGEIPSHWETRRVKYLFREIDERSKEGEETLLSVSQYTGVTVRGSDNNSRESESLEGYKVCYPDDFVSNIMLAWMGAFGVTSHHGIVSPAYCVYRLKGDNNPKYFDHLFHTPHYLAEFARNSTGIISSRWRLYTDDFFRIFSILPPREEQDAIVAFLREQTAVINQFLTNKRRLIALLEEQKQVVINTAVTQGLDTAVARKPSGIDWLGDIPAHWSVAPVYARFSVQLGKMLDTKRITGKYLQPYLRNTDVQWDEINVANLPQMDFSETDKQRFSLKPGDLLVCEGGEVGRAAIWQNQLPECYYQKALHRLRPLSERDDSRFMFYLLKNAVSCDVFVGGTEKATIYHLTAEKLKRHRFPFPPKVEQKQIVSYIAQKTAEINAAIERTQREIELIEEYRTTLIAHAVTGKIDVSGARHGP